MCGGTTTARGLPDLGVSMRQPPRWVAPRPTESTLASTLTSLRRSSITSPQRSPHHAEMSTRARSLRLDGVGQLRPPRPP